MIKRAWKAFLAWMRKPPPPCSYEKLVNKDKQEEKK